MATAHEVGAGDQAHGGIEGHGQQSFPDGTTRTEIPGYTNHVQGTEQGDQAKPTNPDPVEDILFEDDLSSVVTSQVTKRPGRQAQHQVGNGLQERRYDVVRAGLDAAQGDVMAGEGRRGGADDDQYRQNVAL